MKLIEAGKLNRRITIEAPTSLRDPVYGTSTSTWTALATVWAEVRDVLPSRAENVADGISMQRRPCRIRMRYREDITSDMRIDIDGRKLRIVAGPAELGRREGLELVAEELSTSGDAP